MSTKQTIQSWADETKKSLIANYLKLGLKASGKWEKELESNVEEKGTEYRITLLGSSYSQQIVSGRRQNVKQYKDSIKAFVGWAGSTFLADWVKNKGLTISPFAVAYKIARKGINVPNRFNTGTLVSDVITDDRINKLLKEIVSELAGDIKTDLIRNFR